MPALSTGTGAMLLRRTILATGALGFLAGAARAQSGAQDAGGGDGIKRIKAAGKIVFAQSGSPAPPLYYHDPETQKPAGFDAEIASLIARDLGVQAVFEEAGVAARISGLQAGRYDVALGATVNTPARALLVAFTRGYVPYQQVLMLNAAVRAQSAGELNDAKYSIAVAAGSSAEDTARLIFTKAAIKPMPLGEAVQAVVSGAASASLLELYLAGPFARSQPGVRLMGGADRPTIVATEYGCLAVRASDMALRDWLDNWLYWYETHGVLGAMYDRIMAPAQRGR